MGTGRIDGGREGRHLALAIFVGVTVYTTGYFIAGGFGAVLGYVIVGLRPGEVPPIWMTVLGFVVMVALLVPAVLVGRRVYRTGIVGFDVFNRRR